MEAPLSLLYALAPADFNSSVVSCDCLAHVYSNAAVRVPPAVWTL
ncbi:hypothetical protein HNQ79_006679 [Streptomyces candidus]|uniref:Uncharacterized protein n=1 Tax=Streptomyces candidus TaxID=67283 RepID=A0A7X0HM32_9ACTN|nr:hypothetical protein [Streptomyces candidus]